MRAFVLLLVPSLVLAQDTDAAKLIAAGHWKRARAIVERRIHQDPRDPEASFLLSQVRYAFGDVTSPLDLAADAVRLDPGVARYHRQLAEVQGILAQRANIFQQIGIARRFRREIDAALALDPNDVQALRDLLEYYVVAPGIVGGDLRKAADVARRIAAIDPAEGLLAEARIAGSRDDAPRAAALLRRAAALRPPSYKALATLAAFDLAPAHRDDAAAESLARQAIALDPDRSAAWAVLAQVYAARPDFTSLDRTLDDAARAVPDDPLPCYRAAEILLAAGRDPSRAERYLRIYLSQEPEGGQPTAAAARELLHKLGETN